MRRLSLQNIPATIALTCTFLVAAFVLPTLPFAAHAEGAKTHYDIPAQPLASALRTLADAGDLQLVFEPAIVVGIQTPGIKGDYTALEALRILIAPSGLTYSFDGKDTVVVRRLNSASADDSINLAQVTAEQTQQRTNGAGELGKQDRQDDEIVVTGTNIRGAKDTPSPRLTITREDIEKTGFTTIEGLLESLPQNFDGLTPDAAFSAGASNLVGANARISAVAIDLHGLGADSTLTLVNGRRRAGILEGRVVDVSAIPLSAIERMEVVTGGASAIYGADAVAGVVNLVLRRDFEGAESQISLGGPTGYSGGERLQMSQIWGRSSERSGFVLAYDYARDWLSEMQDTGLLSPVPNIDIHYHTLALQNEMRRHSGFAAGRLSLGGRVELHADLLFMDRRYENAERYSYPGIGEISGRNSTPSEQYGGAAGMKVRIGGDWSLDLSGAHSVADMPRTAREVWPDFIIDYTDSQVTRLSTGSLIADGSLFAIGRLIPQAAFGLEYREEATQSDSTSLAEAVDFFLSYSFADDRTVRSAFTEVRLPFVEDGSAGMKRLELSLGARHDDYSDMGSTFNHTVGLIWQPGESLTLRATHTSAFRAPSLFDLVGSGFGTIVNAADPTQGGADAPAMLLLGRNAGVEPEEAVSWSAGFEYAPRFAPWAQLSLSWFSVEYDNRIAEPFTAAERPLVLQREDRFQNLIQRQPTSQDLADFLAAFTSADIADVTGAGTTFTSATAPQTILDAFPGLVLVDGRTDNLAFETLQGLDVKLDTEFETTLGQVDFGVNAAYTAKHEYKVTATSPENSRLNEIGKPVDLRLRANLGWTRDAYGAVLYLNYTPDYANPLSTPASRMDAWTTLDLTLRFDGTRLAGASWLKDVRASFSVNNLLDKDPPRFPGGGFFGVLYDASNASAVGRFASLRVSKNWGGSR